MSVETDPRGIKNYLAPCVSVNKRQGEEIGQISVKYKRR